MVIQEAAHEDANIIFGAVIEPELGDEIRITVIATGFPVEEGLPTEETPGIGRTLPPPAARGVGHASQLPHRLVSPPRLTSPVITQPIREKQAFVSQGTSAQTLPIASSLSQASISPIHQSQRTPNSLSSFDGDSNSSKPSDLFTQSVSGASPNGANESALFGEGASITASTPMDVAREALELASWTVDDQDRPLMSISEDLAQPLIERFEAPGTLVFNEAHSSVKTMAEQIFVSDQMNDGAALGEVALNQEDDTSFSWGQPSSIADESRAGASLAAEEFSWDFDTPNPGVVSDEIDRRIDEALALAEKMSELGSPSTTATNSVNRGQNTLDLDDLDLPAFLRMSPDTRQDV